MSCYCCGLANAYAMSTSPKNLRSELLHLAWPMLIAQLAVMAGGVIDTIMAGRLGAVDLAAVGIGTSIYFTVFVGAVGILLALTPTVAHLYGSGEREGVGEEVRQSIWLALLLSAIVVVILQRPDPLLGISQLTPEVEAKVRAYLDNLSWGVPAAMLFRVFYGFSTGIGRPRPVMVLNLIGVIVKVPVNAVFMYGGFGLTAQGAPGCAAATTLIAWLLCGLAWTWCSRNDEYLPYGVFRCFSPPRWSVLRQQFRLGLPIGATYLVDVTAFTFMALFIARLGPSLSAAHQIAANLGAVLFMLPLSIGHAAGVLAGHALGAGDRQRARQTCRLALAVGFGFALAIGAAVWWSAATIAALYTADRTVQASAVVLLHIVAFYHLADATLGVTVNVLRGHRKTTVPMAVFAVMLWGVGLFGGYLFGLTETFGAPLGAAGFWIAAAAAAALAAMLMVAYLAGIARVVRVPE
jgi:MATE family multidrug resistance protein